MKQSKGYIIPTIFEGGKNNWKAQDIYSKLLEDRVVFLNEEVNTYTASIVTTSLLYLEGKDSKLPIRLVINTPGGSVMDGLSIIDTMNFISCPVSTIVTGMAASMGCMILAAGEPGMRYALPNAQIMAHQVSSGMYGQQQDLEKHYEHTKHLNNELLRLLGEYCGMEPEKVKIETDRDKWLTSKGAKEFGSKGIVDKIITNSTELLAKKKK